MRKRNNLDFLCYFHSINVQFCIDCAYLSVNRVNGIGENSNFSSQLLAELHCASPIPYHLFISFDDSFLLIKRYSYVTGLALIFRLVSTCVIKDPMSKTKWFNNLPNSQSLP